MRESRGSIVNVSSTSGLSGDANLSTMAKRYINNSDDPAAARAEIDADSPMGRIARPGEIAASILYLASDAGI